MTERRFLRALTAAAIICFAAAYANGVSQDNAASESEKKKLYVVKKGDTLSDIIWALKTEGVNVSRIHDWNPNLGTRILPGEKIMYLKPDMQTQPASREDIERAVTDALKKIPQTREVRDKRQPLLKQPWFITSGVVMLVIVIMMILAMRYVRKEVRGASVTIINPPDRNDIAKIAVDPALDEMKTLLDQSKGNPVPFLVSLPREGMRIPCLGVLHNGHVVVKFKGENNLVAWDKKRIAASRIAARQGASVSISS